MNRPVDTPFTTHYRPLVQEQRGLVVGEEPKLIFARRLDVEPTAPLGAPGGGNRVVVPAEGDDGVNLGEDRQLTRLSSSVVIPSQPVFGQQYGREGFGGHNTGLATRRTPVQLHDSTTTIAASHRQAMPALGQWTGTFGPTLIGFDRSGVIYHKFAVEQHLGPPRRPGAQGVGARLRSEQRPLPAYADGSLAWGRRLAEG